MSDRPPNLPMPSTNGFDEFLRRPEFRAIAQQAQNRRLTILIAGRAGVGKATTLNNLVGRAVAPVGDYSPRATNVTLHPVELEGLPLNIVITPGLGELEGRDNTFVTIMQDSIKEFDSLWYVTRLDDSRVRSDEKHAIRLLSQAYQGSELNKGRIWQSAIIVFTFAGNVPPDLYSEALSRRTELIRREIALHAGPEIAEKVRSVAVENCAETAPDGNPWRTALFTTAMLSLRREDVVASVIQLEVATTAAEKSDGLGVDNIAINIAPTSRPPRIQRWEEFGRKIGGRFGAVVGRVVGRIATWLLGV